uniref:Riboflavin kinase n=1 Tax=Timema californicum TaxID=61474 RepID=A0A7R9J6U4_TIMCA|nr:unnamed protein product [Timema californicum]
MANNELPYFTFGKVVKGFGRGSKELGIPTANFDDQVVSLLPPGFQTGVYYGWAQVDDGPVYKMVMSIGWNPFYKNIKKSMETHIIHTFPEDFYDSTLKVCILGYRRPELNFNSLEEMIAAIKDDIRESEDLLNNEENAVYKDHTFFTELS